LYSASPIWSKSSAAAASSASAKAAASSNPPEAAGLLSAFGACVACLTLLAEALSLPGVLT